MAIDDKTRDEKLQNHINRGAAKTSPLWSAKLDHEFPTDQKILPSNWDKIIEQAKFTNRETSWSFKVPKPFLTRCMN